MRGREEEEEKEEVGVERKRGGRGMVARDKRKGVGRKEERRKGDMEGRWEGKRKRGSCKKGRKAW